jgi:gag-polypeptide of LTR copia-type
MSTSTAPKDSTIDKIVLAMPKLKGRDDWPIWSANLELALDHTWDYIEGVNATAPDPSKIDEHKAWTIGDKNTRRRIWLALNEPVQQAVFHHFRSPATTLFKALKNAYEYSGASTEFYARQKYDNAKVSDYDSISDYLTDLINLAHRVNKEISSDFGRIEDRTIAMRLIHSLPPCMRTMQTLLIDAAPVASMMTWDLDNLRRKVEADELRACAAGESLGTRSDSSQTPKALAAEDGRSKGKKRDPNDPTWLARQTCWRCGKVGHLCTKCSSTQAEKDAYQLKRIAERERERNDNANATVAPEAEASALYAEYITDTALVAQKHTETIKPWIVDSGCSNHFSPNKSEFTEYTPFNTPRHIRLGNSSHIPSLGEGTALITCFINGKRVARQVLGVQYVPDLAYALLSCQVMMRRGLQVIFNDTCQIL